MPWGKLSFSDLHTLGLLLPISDLTRWGKVRGLVASLAFERQHVLNSLSACFGYR
jgi:hypothetical protein